MPTRKPLARTAAEGGERAAPAKPLGAAQRHGRHPRPIHSGDFEFVGTDTHYHTHNHLSGGAQNVLQGCIRAFQGLPTRAEREAVLAHLLAALVHSGHIQGYLKTFDMAGHMVNHYKLGSLERN